MPVHARLEDEGEILPTYPPDDSDSFPRRSKSKQLEAMIAVFDDLTAKLKSTPTYSSFVAKVQTLNSFESPTLRSSDLSGQLTRDC